MATMTPQTIQKNNPTALKKNTFVRSGYEFQGWAESSGATTATYTDQHIVTFSTNKNLYAVWKSLPALHQICFILDTSGSMTPHPDTTVTLPSKTDYPVAASDMTAAMWAYRQQDPKSIFKLYHGAYTKDMRLYAGNLFPSGTSSKDALFSHVYGIVSNQTTIPKHVYAGESLVSDLYYAINKELGSLSPRFSSSFNGPMTMTFLILTDANVISANGTDSFNAHVAGEPTSYDLVYGAAGWFKNWQDKSNLNKFPSMGSSSMNHQRDDWSSGHTQAGQWIAEALRLASYYYGVNLTWSLSWQMSKCQGQEASANNDVAYRTVTPFLKYDWNETFPASDDYQHAATNSTIWQRDNSAIPNPMETMVMVEYHLPPGVSIKSSSTVSYIEGMYNMDVQHQFIKISDNKYCVFRYRNDLISVIVPQSLILDGNTSGKTWKKDGVPFSSTSFNIDSAAPDKITMVLS